MEYFIQKAGNVVKIIRPFQSDIVLDMENVKLAVRNIQQASQSYASDEAYQKHLKMYQDALASFGTGGG